MREIARLPGADPRFTGAFPPARTGAGAALLLRVMQSSVMPILMRPPAVAFEHVALAFDDNVVLRDVSFTVRPGRMTILIGASGSGKSVVLKLILGLLKPDAGAIRVNGRRVDALTEAELMEVRDDIGMLFQESALFDSLTVAENVGFKLSDRADLPADQVRRRVEEVLGFIGLGDYIDRFPSELSGGQRRRARGSFSSTSRRRGSIRSPAGRSTPKS